MTAFGADLGFVSDSSALVGVDRYGDHYEVVSVDEMRPRKGHPLRPSEVIATFAQRISTLGGAGFMADAHYRESAREHLEPCDLRFDDAPAGRDGKEEVYLHARKLIHERRVRLPNHPRLLSQLRSVIARPMPGGGTQITIPRRRGIGGHGDIASAFVLALYAATDSRPPVDPWAMARAHRELAAAASRGGPYYVEFPGVGAVGDNGGFEFMNASYDGIGDPPSARDQQIPHHVIAGIAQQRWQGR
jgi:hypothetical protein